MSSIILQMAVLPEPTTPEIKIFSGLYSKGNCVCKPRLRSNAS